MNILLIQPFITLSDASSFQTEPLGLAYLAAYIKNDYNVEILDLFAIGVKNSINLGDMVRIGISKEEDIVEIIKKKNPDVIGITSNFTSFADDSMEVAKIIRNNFKDIVIVMGGAHASMDAETILKDNSSIDIIVKGEGEETFKKLLDCIRDKKSYTSLDGLVFRDKNIIETSTKSNIVSNPKRKLIKDINLLPYPAREMLEIDVYKDINSKNLLDCKNTPVLTMMTSRGCPFNCVFCSTKVVWEQELRHVSAENVVNEMEYMVEHYGIKEIAIYDDQFLAKKKRIHEICDLIISRKLNITISVPSGVSGWLLDEALICKMKMAGFYKLSLSIEVGNERSLKFIDKPVRLDKMKGIIDICHKYGFWVQSNFIIGFPYETKEDIEETIEYAINCGVDYALFLIAQPYAGADLYDLYKKENMLTKTDCDTGTNSITSANYDTKNFTAAEIENFRNYATKRFLRTKLFSYMNPIIFFKQLFPKIFLTKGGVNYAIKVFSVIASEKLFNNSRLNGLLADGNE